MQIRRYQNKWVHVLWRSVPLFSIFNKSILTITIHQQHRACPIKNLYLKCLGITISSHSSTVVCNCKPCRTFQDYFRLYISLQASMILLRRFNKKRMVMWLRRQQKLDTHLALHYIRCTNVQLLRWDLQANIWLSSLGCSIIRKP
jgi:hypothetical protein